MEALGIVSATFGTIFALHFVLSPLVACTASARDTAIRVGEGVCEVVLTAVDPALAPLCTTVGEIALALNALESSKAAPAAVPDSGVLPHPADDLHRQITAARGDGGT